MTVLYILLFIVCLSTLIMVHEAGHLVTAKIFKVYCFEYAIGFGPRLLSFKRKNGETRFSIRAIPFGGFVSMYGEADAVPPEYEGVEIDPNRSINKIKHWKRAIIMTSGIMMNFVLALVVFFIYEVGFPGYQTRIGHILVNENTIAYNVGLRSFDYVTTPYVQYGNNTYVFYDSFGELTYNDSSSKEVYVGYNLAWITLKDQSIYNKAVAFETKYYGTINTDPADYQEINIEEALTGDYFNEQIENVHMGGYIKGLKLSSLQDGLETKYYLELSLAKNYLDPEEEYITAYKQIILDTQSLVSEYNVFINYVPLNGFIEVVGDIKTVNDKYVLNEEGSNKLEIFEYETTYPNILGDELLRQTNLGPKTIDIDFEVLDESHIGDSTIHHIKSDINNGNLDTNLGLHMQIDWFDHSFGTAVVNTFKDFGKSTTLIFRGLGQLFTKEGFKNVGGIIAIGVATTNTLEQNGFGLFIYMWAMISVNLGIVNLLPFPGLDGWQFLVTIVEGVAHKEIPPKVKNTVSAVGIMLLFGLMILIIIKDIIMVV